MGPGGEGEGGGEGGGRGVGDGVEGGSQVGTGARDVDGGGGGLERAVGANGAGVRNDGLL
jgi:hypothetical protein